MIAVFTGVLNISISAGYLILAVIAVRFLFRKIPKSLICFLWILVGIRLLMPQLPESNFSVLPGNQIFSESDEYENMPVIETGYEKVDTAANKYLQEEFMVGANPDSVSTYQLIFLFGTIIWIVGMIGFAGYFVYSWMCIKGKIITAVPEMTEGTKIYRCEEIDEPFLFGMIKPKIYVPWQLSDEELRSVLLHESAHMERKDYLVKPIFYMVLILHWFNPLVWISYILLGRDIEFACDERVMRGLGEEGKRIYATTLLSCSVKKKRTLACPVAFGEGGVKPRIQRIMSYKKPGICLVGVGIIVCILLGVCLMTEQKQQADESALVYEEYEISLIEAVGCEETGMLQMSLEITSDTIAKEEVEAFGNMLDMGMTGFSHSSSGSVVGGSFVKRFSGSFAGDIESVLQIGIMGKDFSFEVIGSFPKEMVRWEEAERFKADSSMGEVEITVSPHTLKIACLEGKPEKRMVYDFMLHMASGEKWKAARVPLMGADDVNLSFDKELYYDFGTSEEDFNLETGKAGAGISWKFVLSEELDLTQIVSVSLEEVSLKNK